MTDKHFVLATAGHVDHGKSTLVKALTGINPDRLPEEKARGISIELGFAELNLSGPNGERFHVGIIDVPGHEDFVRNMIAGVGSIDLALIVVAADDGWMPQTEEHFQIITYLRVRQAVIALTKSDLGDGDAVESQIRQQLQATTFAAAPIVRTSVRAGNFAALSGRVPETDVVQLKNALASQFAKLPAPRDIGKPRLFVDRAFTLRGIGPVVTGTLNGGSFSRGQIVNIEPRGLSARIRSIQIHGRDLDRAEPGTRSALNLVGISVGSEGDAVRRGDVITAPDVGRATKTLEVLLARSARVTPNSPAARPIKNRSCVYFHHGTSRVTAKVTLLETKFISPGQKALAELRLQSPVFAFMGDRFVLRDASERYTIAGGSILSIRCNDNNEKLANRVASLSARAAAPDDCAVSLKSELARVHFAECRTLLHLSNFNAHEISSALNRLEQQKRVVVIGEIAADPEYWAALRSRAAHLIDECHRQRPNERGLRVSDLRAAVGLKSEIVFAALLLDLVGFVRIEDRVGRKDHHPALATGSRTAADEIVAILSTRPFDPPSRKEIARNRDQHEALRFLIDQAEVLEVGSDVMLLKQAAARMQRIVADFIARNGPATASELRQALDSSRRVVIPFLEYLDRAGVTRREGDKRMLRGEISRR